MTAGSCARVVCEGASRLGVAGALQHRAIRSSLRSPRRSRPPFRPLMLTSRPPSLAHGESRDAVGTPDGRVGLHAAEPQISLRTKLEIRTEALPQFPRAKSWRNSDVRP